MCALRPELSDQSKDLEPVNPMTLAETPRNILQAVHKPGMPQASLKKIPTEDEWAEEKK